MRVPGSSRAASCSARSGTLANATSRRIPTSTVEADGRANSRAKNRARWARLRRCLLRGRRARKRRTPPRAVNPRDIRAKRIAAVLLASVWCSLQTSAAPPPDSRATSIRHSGRSRSSRPPTGARSRTSAPGPSECAPAATSTTCPPGSKPGSDTHAARPPDVSSRIAGAGPRGCALPRAPAAPRVTAPAGPARMTLQVCPTSRLPSRRRIASSCAVSGIVSVAPLTTPGLSCSSWTH